MKGNSQEWHNTTSKDKVERIALECKMRNNLSIAWRIIASRENFDKQDHGLKRATTQCFRNERIEDR